MTTTQANTGEAFAAGIPGVYRGVAAQDYHALKAVSSSVLKRIHTHSPQHALDLMTNGMDTSDEMDIGSAVHCALFTPSEFEGLYGIAAQCCATTGKGEQCSRMGAFRCGGAGAPWYCEQHGKGHNKDDGFTVLSPADDERVEGIESAVRANKTASDILNQATEFELSVLVRDEDTGLLLKARLDILCEDIAVMPDLKTCRSAKPRHFQRQAYDLAYHIQLSFYRRVGLAAGLSIDITPVIAVENVRPFAVTVFEPTPSFVQAGERDMAAALAKYAECEKAGCWPGYADAPHPLDVPAYANGGTL